MSILELILALIGNQWRYRLRLKNTVIKKILQVTLYFCVKFSVIIRNIDILYRFIN